MTNAEQDKIAFQLLRFVLRVSFIMGITVLLWWTSVSFIKWFWFHPLF